MSDESPLESQELPVSPPPRNKGGRPKGSKNRPKRGRPKGSGKPKRRGRPPKKRKPLTEAELAKQTYNLPTIKKLEEREKKEELVIAPTLEAKLISEKEIAPNAEEQILDSYLDPKLMKASEPGHYEAREKIINANPVDSSHLYRGIENIPAQGAQYQFTADMVAEIEKCSKDIMYFAENYFEIASIDRGKHKIDLYDAQKRVLQSMLDSKYMILTASRQCGKSSLMTIYALWVACFQSDQSIVIVANKEDIASKIFKRVRMAYEQLPNFLKPGVKEYAKTFMTLENDSVINVSTTTSTSARGTTISVLVVDEMSFVPRHIIEEFWSSVIPTISSGKKAKMFVVSCVTGDTHVITEKGIQQINEIVQPEKIGAYETAQYTICGKQNQNTGTILFNNGKQDTLIFKTPHSSIECSKEHKFWSCKNGNYGWHKAEELQEGDFIALKIGQNIWGNNDDVSTFNPRSIAKHKNVWKPDKITPEIAYFIGLFIAEGSVYKRFINDKFVGGTVTITCGDESVANSIKKLGLPSSIDKEKIRHTISSLHLIQFLEYLGFDLKLKAPKKIIPSRLLQMSKENVIALLRGMFDGDGCCNNYDGSVNLASTSYQLLVQVRTILQNFGILSCIQTKTIPPNYRVKVTSIQHTVEINLTNSKKFIEEIGFNIERKQQVGLKHHKKQYKCASKHIIPFGCSLLRKELFKRGVGTQLTKAGITIDSVYNPKVRDLSRYTFLKIKNSNITHLLSKEFNNFLDENVEENLYWDKIKKIEKSSADVYDFSLPDNPNDPWCHSVIYNGYVGHQTPNGTDNKFYEIYSQAEQGHLEGWKAERIDWWDVPGRDEQWKREAISALGGSEEKFLQEYGNVFLDNNSSAVGAAIIERFKQNKKPAIWTSEDGEYNVYEYPDKNKLYVIGVDVGEGIGRAASVAQVLDVTDLQNIKQVAVYGSAIIEPYHFANKLSVIGQSWGLAPMLIERNNCGAQVIDALHYKHHYEKIVVYTKISEQEKYNRTRHMGVLSHTNIRFDGIQNMRYWVNHLQTVHINDPQTISEFETFVKQPNGSYRKRNDNFFDDRIMALVWALFILEPEICQQYFEIIDYDLQHKPLKIASNGYWENLPEFYDLKDLGKIASIIPKPYRPEDEVVSATLGITQKDLDQADKYDLDLEQLMEMGYEFLQQPDV